MGAKCKVYEQDSIIDLIKGLHKINKKIISASYYQRLSSVLPYPSIEEILEVFPLWTDLLDEADIINKDEESIHTLNKLNKLMKIPKEKWSVEYSLSYYSRLKGKFATVQEYEHLRRSTPSMVSSNTVINYFGTWQNALQQNGMCSTKRYSKERCIKYLLKAKEELDPYFNSNTYAKWAKENDAPSLRTIYKHVGSWSYIKRLLYK